MVRVGKNDESSAEEKRRTGLNEIHRKLANVHTRKLRTNESLEALQAFTEKHGFGAAKSNKSKALNVYSNVLKNCEADAEGLRKILSDIDKLRKTEFRSRMRSQLRRHALMQLLAQQAACLPLYVGGVEGHPPPFVGAIHVPETTALKQGDAVAALVEDNWILAEIQAVNDKGKYDVKDVDDEQKTRLTIARKRLIPLPKYRADPLRDGHALFPKEALVLALYPQTTCFYKGVVEKSPESATDDYHVAFEDTSYAHGYSPPLPIPQRYVVSHKDIKNSKWVG